MSKAREWWIKGHMVLIDEEDYPILSRMSWHIRKDKKTYYAYASVKIGGKVTCVSMHRMITGLRTVEIDHRNRNGLDNRKSNLRFASAKENSRNRVRLNSLGFRGVYKPKRSANYSVQIQIEGKRYHEYGFSTAEEAARRYDELSKEHHGEFGIRNFKD